MWYSKVRKGAAMLLFYQIDNRGKLSKKAPRFYRISGIMK